MKEIIKKGVNEKSLYIYKMKCSECNTVYTFEYDNISDGYMFHGVRCPECGEVNMFLFLKPHRYKKKTKQCPDCERIISDYEERCHRCQMDFDAKKWQDLWDKISGGSNGTNR